MTQELNQREVVLATHNKGKITEFEAALAPLGIKLLSAEDTKLEEPEETGTSFTHNALLKARAAARFTNHPALADDSGLVIPALNGHPGINSKRWAESCGGFPAAFTQLENLLKGVDVKNAYFECALALCWPNGRHEVFIGRVQGHLSFPARGNNGFGYDPIFKPEGSLKTFGDMQAFEKQAVSHRARAIEKLVKACVLYPLDFKNSGRQLRCEPDERSKLRDRGRNPKVNAPET